MEFNRTLVIGLIIGIILSYLLIEIKNNCWIKNDSQTNLNKILNNLIRQSARWSVAAEQDKNPMIAVLHANYGAAYLWAADSIATSSQIETATGINYLDFRKKIIDIQKMVTVKMASVCPQFAPEPSALTKIAGEGI